MCKDSILNTPHKFLVVDDNIFALDIMDTFLKRNGFEVALAENGQIGLDLYLADPTRYSIVFLDIQMPVMDGNEMAMRIRSSGKQNASCIPIVAMSGSITGDVLSKDGFSHFLKKPFTLQSVLILINDLTN